jgi:hypothetical protein
MNICFLLARSRWRSLVVDGRGRAALMGGGVTVAASDDIAMESLARLHLFFTKAFAHRGFSLRNSDILPISNPPALVDNQ